MNIISLFSTFKKKQQTLKLPDSLLIRQLKEISKKNDLSLYKNITIYHHAKEYFIPLLILDKKRGIFLFEYKEWSYDDLKNSTVSKASHQDSNAQSIAYEKTHEFIRQKFNELTHKDGVPIYNYLLMQNLNSDEYEHLNSSFRELLPLNKILFNDSDEEQIIQKLNDVPCLKTPILKEADIMGNLLVQYLILSKDKSLNLATSSQIEFIETDLKKLITLNGVASSGKTSSILLKSILEILKNPKLKIIIIEPTRLACDLLKQKLLNIIEYAIIEIDLNSIEIITPLDLLNRHLSKLNKPKLELVLHINEKLMKKSFKAADLIICDDTKILPLEFIDYLIHIQKKSLLILVNADSKRESNFILKDNFKTTKAEVIFKRANQHAKSLQIISTLLEEYESKDILIISDNLSKKKLLDDLDGFVEERVIAVDSSLSLISQDLNGLLLCSYSDIASMNSKIVILMDIEDTSLNQLEYAATLAQKTLFILHEKECQNIKILKEKYE
ncbi:MAG: hypothetical protein M0Q24_06860 [Sulfurimonas sp.]|uniref:hypothetical protein n=1 Tax=Sulfurimonas sp. TaxID=2022749 RepID=UPI0025FE513D|nr:hypothetical protein [Sulfurimonas sp.]MCK9491794.1 hypothetical protein [Sulfurimonas sp.]